jgi:pyridoxine 5'-phosphate synthase PdxJ
LGRWTAAPERYAPELLNLSTPDITSYGGMDASMLSRMKELEDENRRLKEMHAEMQLQVDVLKEAVQKSGEVEEANSQP